MLHPSLTAAPDQMGADDDAVRAWLGLVQAGRFGERPPPRDSTLAANLAATDALFRVARRRARGWSARR